VSSALADLAVIDDQDLVGRPDGGQPVRDDQGGTSGQRCTQRALHGGLGLGVQVRGGLVKDHDRWPFQQQPRQRDPLLLAARKPVSTVADDGVEAVGQYRDQVLDLRRPARLGQLLLGCRWPGVGEVGPDGVVEHVRVLGDDADRVMQRVQGDVPEVVAADAYRARARVIHP